MGDHSRPAAGDCALGELFIERTRPFVFPRYFDDDTLEEILEVKRRTEAQIADRGATERDAKMGRGGIRDIEFAVQALQLLNGGKSPDLRTPNTLEAIEALGERGLLTAFEATALASNYAFLRQIEHRLQIEGSQQRHELPHDPADLDAFGVRLGYASGASFMAAYRDRAKETRDILDRFLATEGAGNLWVGELLDPHSDGAAGIEQLAALGFCDPAKARAELLGLCVGPPQQPFSLHVRQQFAAIAPRLIEALAHSTGPDTALVRLGRLLANLRAPSTLYDILKADPDLCSHLVTLVSNSEYLTELLIRDPGLFDLFGAHRSTDEAVSRADIEAQLADLCRAYDAAAAPYRLRDGELLRIGLRELFDNITVFEVGHELTRLAEVCLAHALADAQAKVAKRHGPTDAAFAVLGLGKLGGRELGYGSDLDLVFVYDADAAIASGVAPAEYFAAVASTTIRSLKDSTQYGALYDVDARLRPDGSKGMLAISHRRIEAYYQHDAQAWERLALVKVRAVAGDAAFGKTVADRARDIAFSVALTSEMLDEIEAIREKIVLNASPLDLKKDEGGLAEIEFTVRLLQLRYAAGHPELKRGDVIGAIDGLVLNNLLGPADFGALANAYLLFRKIENRVRMMHGRSGSALPEEPKARADLAKRLHIDGDLAKVVHHHKIRIHALYKKVRHAAVRP